MLPKNLRFLPFSVLLVAFMPGNASAKLEFCNATDAKASVAIGYEDDGNEWKSEGWWAIEPGKCKTVIGGALKRRSYYWRATSKSYKWSKSRFMFCTSPDIFTIEGDENCKGRGFDRNPFNKIELDAGIKDFKFTLSPPPKKKSSAPKEREKQEETAEIHPSPARQLPAPKSEPGTHGEPYSVGGLLGGCEGTDTSIICNLYNEGFRYVVSTSGPGDPALVENLMDIPVNTPMSWSGDMMFYQGAIAEVMIREARQEGQDPFASLRARLQGYWVSVDDPDYNLLLAGSLFEEYSQNIPSDSYVLEIARQCTPPEGSPPASGTPGKDPYLIAHPLTEDGETRCFQIMEATGDKLIIFPLGVMSDLEFRKAG